MYGDDDLVKSHKFRADLIGNLILASFAIVLARLWYLQVYQGALFYRVSIDNRLRKEIVKAPRGMVFSRNNQLIVNNIPRFDVVITPQYLQQKKVTLRKLAKILDIPYDYILKELQKKSTQASYRPVIIKKNISQKEVAIIETENSKLPGVSVTTFISRDYLDKKVGAHILGYTREISKSQLPQFRKRDNYDYKIGDYIGQNGLEEELDKLLRGEDGHQFMEVDASGRMKRVLNSNNIFKGIKNLDIRPGNNIRLTIDRDMQLAAYNALEGKVGAAVAVNIHSGEVLAMVSRPSFLPSNFSKGLTPQHWEKLRDDKGKPLLNRTVQGTYAPGSTYKAITAIAALEEGIIDLDTEVKCTGKMRLGSRPYHCWKKWGHGKVNITKAIRESCNIFFYKIGSKIDIDVLSKYARLFGLGSNTGVTLPREKTGLIPSKEWKLMQRGIEWQLGETLSCAIGQSFVSVTPLQLSLVYAAIANGGKLYRPFLVKEVFSNSGKIIEKYDKQLVREVEVSDRTLQLVKEGLYQVVNNPKGTAWWQRGVGLHMAGKTGTSEVIRHSVENKYTKCEEYDYESRHHAVFAAYVPVEDPQIAMSVVVEHGCHGSSGAAPVAREMAKVYMEKYMPKLHEKLKEEDRVVMNKFWAEWKKKKEETNKVNEEVGEDE
ncbi:MAG: penicillin-binding protein 2 [Halobacteriovoraceae bacterium]|nr:penicillin-binding protein 2 [Halobacteriovoraceae bacterium]